MKRKQLIILCTCFVLAVAAWYYVQQPRKTAVTDIYSTITQAFPASSVKSIEARVLSHPEKPLRLKLGKDGWTLVLERNGRSFNAPAKRAKVERLIKLLSELQGELRADGKDHLSTFGLEEGHGLEIVLKNGDKKVAAIVAGMKGPDWSSCFVRPKDSERVYLVSKDIFSVFDIWSKRPDKALNLDPWVDLDVISAYPGKVEGCAFKSRVSSWSLKREENPGKVKKPEKEGWIFETGGKRIEKTGEEARKYLSGILPLRAREIEPPCKAGKPGATFKYKLKSGPESTVEIMSCNSKEKTCTVRSRGYFYRVDSSWKEKLEKPFSEKKKDKGHVKNSEGKAKGPGNRK